MLKRDKNRRFLKCHISRSQPHSGPKRVAVKRGIAYYCRSAHRAIVRALPTAPRVPNHRQRPKAAEQKSRFDFDNGNCVRSIQFAIRCVGIRRTTAKPKIPRAPLFGYSCRASFVQRTNHFLKDVLALSSGHGETCLVTKERNKEKRN